MPKLLSIDRKLRTLSRRLVTDAGGAPCCCSPGDTCPCDPALRLAAFRADTCSGGRFGAFYESSVPARIAIVRLQWAGEFENFDRDTAGVTFAERGLTMGTAQWCVIHSTIGQGQYIWILSAATAGYEYQRGGSRIETESVALNLVGMEAVSVPAPPRNAVLWPTVGKNSLSWRDLPRFFGQRNQGPLFAVNDGSLCDYDQTFSNRTTIERNTFQFAGGAAGGQARRTLTYTATGVRQTSSMSAMWTIRYLTCGSGDNPQSLTGERGCSNCGDRTTLEPFA